MPTLIRPIAEGSAGKASRIAVQAFDDSEVLTALRNDAGNLELIGWRTAPGTAAVTRGADSGTQAGTVGEVALTLMGRRAITAVRSGSDRLLLISWDVPPGLNTITRTWDSGTTAGEASEIAMTAVGDDLLVTALRAGDGDLLLISWRLEPDGTISRLSDSGSQAGEVSLVTVAAIDASNVVTAVRNGSGDLELIGWGIASNGSIQRWGDSGQQAGEVGEIAIAPLPSGGATSDVLTAVQNGSGDLLLITWRPSPGAGTIERLADSGGEAGTASAISVCSTVTASGPKVVASMRRGSGNLELIAFEVVGDGPGSLIIRTGDYSNEADAEVTETALLNLDPGRILNAMRITRGCEQPENHLLLTTYSIADPAAAPAPSRILEIQFQNPQLPSREDSSWAASGGDEYPLDSASEWVQVLAPIEEYEGPNLVGCSGWVIEPDDSGSDVPFSHPFGFDWEFQIALDDDENEYPALLSPANTTPQEHSVELADALGLSIPNGMLGLEWDKGLLPASYRARVTHGDRVAAFGRWILDTGHNEGGYWRTEIHPPLLVATGSVQHEGEAEVTRTLFMSRPYLAGQMYAVDPDNAYIDAIDDDGPFFSHLVNELANVILLESRRIEAHPKVKSFPFKGAYRLHIIVRPPRRPASPHDRLTVSFQFTVRSGCSVHVTSTSHDRIDVLISLDDAQYTPPDLPGRKECVYHRDELDKLSSGSGIKILILEALTIAVASRVPFVGWALAAYVVYIFSRGIKTDLYDSLPEIDVLESKNAVTNAFADEIPAGKGIVVNNEQHYPVYGWLEAKWTTPSGVGGLQAAADERAEKEHFSLD
jgi:hypothetical protein